MGLGFGYDFLDNDKRNFLIHGNPFSVSCCLKAFGDVSQGSLIDNNNTLRGLPTEIGLTISADTGLATVGNTTEFLLDINDVKIGKPEKGWRLSFKDRQGNVKTFKIEENIVDKTIGVYRMQMTAIAPQGKANRVLGNNKVRRGEGAI